MSCIQNYIKAYFKISSRTFYIALLQSIIIPQRLLLHFLHPSYILSFYLHYCFLILLLPAMFTPRTIFLKLILPLIFPVHRGNLSNLLSIICGLQWHL